MWVGDRVWLSHGEPDIELYTLVAAIEQTAESVAITDSGGVILYANRAYEKMHSVERSGCLGNVAKEITRADDESARAIWQAMEAGKPWTSQVESNVPGGALQIVEISISPVLDEFGTRTNLVIVGRDVSRELQLERQLLQSQRLESVGLLAGGVAHDFNILLQALYGYVDLAQINLHDEQQTTSYLESMREAIERARQHVRKILLYARRAEHRHESWPVQDLVREVTDFLRPSTPSSIRFDIECDEDCPPALISPSDIHQVLVNLCTNAFHAMPSGGVLTIRVGTHEIVNRSPEWERLVPGRYVSLTVRDTGFGIADGDLVKIFDPYFTTKSQEEGTGLGLSVVHSIVVAHGGDIRVSSAKDQGTCFEILLPVGRRQSEQVDPATKDGPAPFYAAHVLLVDDEPSVLKVLKASLLTGGFTVDAFTDPLAALDQFRSSPETYDVVITDQTMPDMKGLELAERLQMERPGIPVILCSGLEPDPEESSAFVSRRMTKPVRPREVIDAVRQLLQQLERV